MTTPDLRDRFAMAFDPDFHDAHEYDQAFGDYDGTSCKLCERERVMIGGATGRRICEKCGTYQDERDRLASLVGRGGEP